MKLEPQIREKGINYLQYGDYYLPNLKLPEETRPLGRWGRLHKEYLKNSRPLLYNNLLLSGKLYTILADLDEHAAERYRLIVQQMAQAEGITDELKENDQMQWVQAMNSILSRVEEIIRTEMIYFREGEHGDSGSTPGSGLCRPGRGGRVPL